MTLHRHKRLAVCKSIKTALPKLLEALGTAQSFADVIENGASVPFAEFEQKWLARTNASAQA